MLRRQTIPLVLLSLLVTPAIGDDPKVFPYGLVPEEKPDVPLSAAMNRVYEGSYGGLDCARNELFSNFKYTPLKGFDYHGHDGTVSRRDSTKVIRVGDKYYVWYTHRETPTPPDYDGGAGETIPSRDWDLAEIWYATSDDGFTWEEQGVAVERMEKPHAGWRSVSTPDILVWKGKYYLYYQAYLFMPGSRESSGTNGDDCPVSVSWSDSPDGPWTPSNKIVVQNGPPGSWDQWVIHDPYPLVYNDKIYLYYKGEMGGTPPVRAQGLAIAEDPLGPFEKHPNNPVINSGHETSLFPFKTGLAALVSRHGLEHNTIQYAPDGVNFEIAATTGLMPIAPGAHVPDAFTGTKDGRGISWGLCHFRNLKRDEGKSHSMLARFDCDLSLDVHDLAMKESDIFNDPTINFKFGLSDEQRKRIEAQTTIVKADNAAQAQVAQSDWSHRVKLPAGEQPIELFNGRDLTGWKGFEKYFSVHDGMIRARNDEPVKMSTFLFTEGKYRNYRLLLEVKQTMGAGYSTMHSAVASVGEHVKNWGGDYGFVGPILMFCHDWGIWGAGGRKRIFPPDQKVPMADTPWEKKGEWNQLEILVVGDRIRMVANGQLMVDFTEAPGVLKKCPIGLQMHNEKRTQEFHFRGLVLVDEPGDQLLTVESATETLQAGRD